MFWSGRKHQDFQNLAGNRWSGPICLKYATGAAQVQQGGPRNWGEFTYRNASLQGRSCHSLPACCCSVQTSVLPRFARRKFIQVQWLSAHVWSDPFVLQQEQAKSKNTGQACGVTFDGTTRLGEALSIVLCFVSQDFEIKQCLVRLQLLAKAWLGKKWQGS